MSKIDRFGDLQLDQDLPFQNRMWTVQRAGWWAMALLVAAALLGLAGAGPLGQGSVSDAGDHIRLDYDRFWRYGKPTSIRVQFDARPGPDGLARIWVDQTYLTRFILQKTVPEPNRVELGEGRLIYAFPVAAGGAGVRHAVTFHLEADERGSVQGRIGIWGGPEIAFSQFIYP